MAEIGQSIYDVPGFLEDSGEIVPPFHPSWGGGTLSLDPVPVTLADGRTAVVDSDGVIIDIK